MNTEQGSQYGIIDQEGVKEARIVRSFYVLSAIICAEMAKDMNKLPEGSKTMIIRSLLEKRDESEGRKEAVKFITDTQSRMRENGRLCNVGAHESRIAYATRWLTLVRSTVLTVNDLENITRGIETVVDIKDIDSNLTGVAVDAYMQANGKLGISSLKLFQEVKSRL